MSMRLTKTVEARVMEMVQNHVPQRRIAEQLGISKSAVARLAGAVKKPAARRSVVASRPRPAAAPAPKPAQASTPGSGRFLARLVAADPEIGKHLAAGAGKVDAIISGRDGSGTELLAMETAQDFADLVGLVVNDYDIGFELDEGESADAFAADMVARGEAELARKVALLEAAIALVRAAGVEPTWLRAEPI